MTMLRFWPLCFLVGTSIPKLFYSFSAYTVFEQDAIVTVTGNVPAAFVLPGIRAVRALLDPASRTVASSRRIGSAEHRRQL